MILDPRACEFYAVTAAIDGEATSALEASFDGGATWLAGQGVGGEVRWLVRGPAAADNAATPSVLVSRSMVPMVRFASVPETIVRSGPEIIVARAPA